MSGRGGDNSLRPSWLIFASRGPYAAEASEIIWRIGASLHALVDNLPGGPLASPLGRVVTPDDLSDVERDLPTTLPLVTPGGRAAAEAGARSHGLRSFPALIDPTAVIARSAAIGEGVSINALAVIGARSRLGRFVLVNRSASVGHDAELHDFVTLGPGCVLAGQVVVESGAFIATGAIISPKVRIGFNAIVGAGAVVLANVPPFSTVVGNPAQVLRTSTTGYNGLSVPADTLTTDGDTAR